MKNALVIALIVAALLRAHRDQVDRSRRGGAQCQRAVQRISAAAVFRPAIKPSTKKGAETQMAKLKAGDLVTVDHSGEPETLGRVEAVQEKKNLVDVRVDHPGHKVHGRVVVFKASEVKPRAEKKEPRENDNREEKGEAKATS